MFGGWYVAGMRVGRVLAPVYGPTATREPLLPYVDKARAAVTGKWAIKDKDEFTLIFLLSPTLILGVANDQTWLKITRDPWNPT